MTFIIPASHTCSGYKTVCLVYCQKSLACQLLYCNVLTGVRHNNSLRSRNDSSDLKCWDKSMTFIIPAFHICSGYKAVWLVYFQRSLACQLDPLGLCPLLTASLQDLDYHIPLHTTIMILVPLIKEIIPRDLLVDILPDISLVEMIEITILIQILPDNFLIV